MLRPALFLTLAATLALANMPASAQSAEAPRHVRKAAKPKRSSEPVAAPAYGGINSPSTDFSKIERADEEPRGPNGPNIRPSIGAGGMGLGTGF